MDLLDLLAKKEAEISERKAEEKRLALAGLGPDGKPKKDPSMEQGWLQNADAKEQRGIMIELTDNKVKRVDKTRLVWAANSSFKGGKWGAPMPARICDVSEVAGEAHIIFPILSNEIIVEFFGMPSNNTYYWRFMKIPKEATYAYNKFPKSSKLKQRRLGFGSASPSPNASQSQGCSSSESSQTTNISGDEKYWDSDGICSMEETLISKFNKTEGSRIHRHVLKIANAFLELSLLPDALSSIVPGEVSADYQDIDVGSSGKDIDLSAYARSDSVKTTEPLAAGDTIEYTDKTFLHDITSKIFEIKANDATTPLILGSGDVIFMDDVVKKLNVNSKGEVIPNSGTRRRLKEYELVVSKLDERALKDTSLYKIRKAAELGNKNVEKKTGFHLNSKKQKTSRDTTPVKGAEENNSQDC